MENVGNPVAELIGSAEFWSAGMKRRADPDSFDFDIRRSREMRSASVLTLAYRSERPRFLAFMHQPGLHVHFRLSGTGRYRVNGSETIDGGATEMQVYYARRSWTKEVFERGESRSHSILFCVPAERASSFLSDHDLGPLDQLPSGFVHLRRRLGPELTRALGEVTSMPEDGVAGLLKEARLLETLAGSFAAMRRDRDEHAGSYRVRPTDRERVAELCRYIDRTLDVDHRAEDLAARANMSLSRFKTVFRAIEGIPVQNWLRQRRMIRAAQMLAAGVSVAEAALAVGYVHFGHFAQVFRSQYGVNPGDYRALPPASFADRRSVDQTLQYGNAPSRYDRGLDWSLRDMAKGPV